MSEKKIQWKNRLRAFLPFYPISRQYVWISWTLFSLTWFWKGQRCSIDWILGKKRLASLWTEVEGRLRCLENIVDRNNKLKNVTKNATLIIRKIYWCFKNTSTALHTTNRQHICSLCNYICLVQLLKGNSFDLCVISAKINNIFMTKWISEEWRRRGGGIMKNECSQFLSWVQISAEELKRVHCSSFQSHHPSSFTHRDRNIHFFLLLPHEGSYMLYLG